IDRNLYSRNSCPPRPTRHARYSTGPGDAKRTATAIRTKTGDNTASATALVTMSSARFSMASLSPPETLDHIGDRGDHYLDISIGHSGVQGQRDRPLIFAVSHGKV